MANDPIVLNRPRAVRLFFAAYLIVNGAHGPAVPIYIGFLWSYFQ